MAKSPRGLCGVAAVSTSGTVRGLRLQQEGEEGTSRHSVDMWLVLVWEQRAGKFKAPTLRLIAGGLETTEAVYQGEVASVATIQDPFPDLPVPRTMSGQIVSELTRFSLPLRRSTDAAWLRRNGAVSYSVTGATLTTDDGDPYVEVPSGKYARAALVYICTWAKITGDKELSLGDSYRQYLSMLGLNWGGAAAAREAIRQLQLIVGSKFTITSHEAAPSDKNLVRKQTSQMVVADSADLWLPADTQDGFRPGSKLVLSDSFMEMLQSSVPVPVPAWTHLLATSKSSLPLDVYLWICSRLYQITRESRITWDQLHQQFGSSSDIRDFKRKFRSALELVREVYPEARIYEQDGDSQRSGFKGYLLKPGSPRASDSAFMRDTRGSVPLHRPRTTQKATR